MEGPTYRIELASSARAGCRAPHCKDQGTKIDKHTMRFGVLVTIQEHQTWHWRHWGCVTPEMIRKWNGMCGGDMELVDGYETLPDNMQQKVKQALEQGHVDDEDWGGDLECNRWTGKARQGMFVKSPKKADKKAALDDDDAESSPLKKKSAKRGRAKKTDEDDIDEAPAPKRGRKSKKAAAADLQKDETDQSSQVQPAVNNAAVVDEDDTIDDAPEAKTTKKPATKKGRAKKSKATVDENDAEADAVNDTPALTKKSRAKKSAVPVDNVDEVDADEMDTNEPEPVAAKSKKRKGKGKKA